MATSLAAKAFQSTQENSSCDYWEYLEHIEAPQWIDLALESSLQGTEGDDPWFYEHHPHHETPLEELVFFPGRKPKDKPKKRFEEDELEFKAEARQSDEAQKEQGRIKAKRVEVLPERAQEQTQSSPLRPSDAFSAKLLATLMARLRTSEEMQAKVSSVSDSKLEIQSSSSPPEVQSSVLHVRKLRVRASIAAIPVSGASKAGSTKRGRPEPRSSPLKGDKENTKSPRRGKVTIPQLELAKQTKARRSLASLEFGKNNVHGSFSVGRGDAGVAAPRRRLSSSRSSPRLKNGFSSKVIGKASRASRVENSSSASNSSTKAKENGDELAALIAKHNSKFKPKPKYEPRLHSTRDIRGWERRTGLQYYDLQPVERVKVNQEISDFKRAQVP